MKRHRVGEKEESGCHGLFLRCWLPAWQVGLEQGAGSHSQESDCESRGGGGGGWKRASKL